MSWTGTTTSSLGQATRPGYSCGRHMAGLFLKLPERSSVIHPVMAPAGAPSSLTASREQGRKPTGATNLFAQLCLDWESDMQSLHWTHPAAFKLPLNGKGKCWRKEVILTALLALFDLCHTVILGHCGPEMLRKQLLLSLSCGKCSLPAPHDCTWSRHGFRGHCAVWSLSCVCCGKQDPWKSYSPCRRISTTAGAIPSSRFGFSVERWEGRVEGRQGWDLSPRHSY